MGMSASVTLCVGIMVDMDKLDEMLYDSIEGWGVDDSASEHLEDIVQKHPKIGIDYTNVDDPDYIVYLFGTDETTYLGDYYTPSEDFDFEGAKEKVKELEGIVEELNIPSFDKPNVIFYPCYG